MMKQRFLAFVLAVLSLLLYISPLAHAATPEKTAKYITVDARGSFYSQKVYEDASGTVFAPITMLGQFGRMSRLLEGSQYVFYDQEEATRNGTPLAGARRILIDKSGKSGKVLCYTASGSYTIIEDIRFSRQLTVNKNLYLPLEELLPLLNAKVEITGDGVLHIYRNPVSLYHALFGHKLDLWVFDKDKYVGSDIITATGLIVDSILGIKVDRLDFITHSGAIKDYSALFTKLITDNETYLSAYDYTETPLDKALGQITSASGDLDDAIGGTMDMLKLAEYMSTTKDNDIYKEFSDSIETVDNIAGFLECLCNITEYIDQYANQVEDHRKMLKAVYEDELSPAAIAANEIYKLYGSDNGEQCLSAAKSALLDWVRGELAAGVIKEANLKPYKIAFSVVKLFLPEATKEFSKAAELYFLDKVVQDAYAAATQRLNQIAFDKSSLEKLRLSLIMTLVSSKHGFETHDAEDCDELKNINQWLEELYLAADSVSCAYSGYYENKKDSLSQSIPYILAVGSSIDPNSPSLPSDGSNAGTSVLEVGDHLYFGSASPDNGPDVWQVIHVDGNYALIYDMRMIYGVFDATVHGMSEAMSLMCYYSYGSATWEYSDVRSWLNSRSAVVAYQDIQFDYTLTGITAVPWPSDQGPDYGGSGGYLNRFTAEEYAIIQPVTHQSLIPYTQSGKSSVCDRDFQNFTVDLEPFYQEPYGVSETTDLMFLLNGWEFREYVLKNGLCGFQYPNGTYLAPFWLRDSVSTDFAGFYYYYGTHMLTAGSYTAGSNSADMSAAIRPACYIDTHYISGCSGAGTFESPYHLTIDASVADRSPEPYTQFLSQPETRQVTFYWNNPTGDYANCDMWIWLPDSEGRGYRFEPCEYGGCVTIEVPADTPRIGFYARYNCSDPGGSSWGEATKDVEAERYVTLEEPSTAVYLQYQTAEFTLACSTGETADPDIESSEEGGEGAFGGGSAGGR